MLCFFKTITTRLWSFANHLISFIHSYLSSSPSGGEDSLLSSRDEQAYRLLLPALERCGVKDQSGKLRLLTVIDRFTYTFNNSFGDYRTIPAGKASVSDMNDVMSLKII